jgi:tetratricopeptide (TPR) repeat protein
VIEGDHESAVRHYSAYCEFLREHNLRSLLSTAAPRLGRELCALGRHDEAEPLAQLGRETGQTLDLSTQVSWRQAQALVHANRGEHAEAERLAREAVAIADRTDMLNLQGDALCDLAEVFRASARGDEAGAALQRALERYEQKKNLAMSNQVRARLAELEAVAP